GRVPTEASQELAKMAERSMQLQATVQDGALTLSSDAGSVHIGLTRWR
ncbi:MAG: YaeQ family protein, partial [Betaproteobacteria bacterium]|nr:YaeQ family protein [Betaproteobacteria bacterium]